MKPNDEKRILELLEIEENQTPLFQRKDPLSKARMVLVDIRKDTIAIRTMVAIIFGINIALLGIILLIVFTP